MIQQRRKPVQIGNSQLVDIMLGGGGSGSDTSGVVSAAGTIGGPYGMSLGTLGQIGLSALSANPVGLAMGLLSAFTQTQSNTTPGKMALDAMLSTVADIGNQMGMVTSATPEGNLGLDGSNLGAQAGTIGKQGPDEAYSPDADIGVSIDSEGAGGSDGGMGSSSSDSGVTGGEGSGIGGDGYAAGGKIPGHDLTGSDSKSIRATPGEFVLPTHIVDLIGEQNLNNFLKLFPAPTPVKGK